MRGAHPRFVVGIQKLHCDQNQPARMANLANKLHAPRAALGAVAKVFGTGEYIGKVVEAEHDLIRVPRGNVVNNVD